MSYAAAAASGPKQSAEEARAPLLNEVLPSDTSTSSLVDVDSPHISAVDSSFSDHELHTRTSSEQRARERSDAAKESAKQDLDAAKKQTSQRAGQAKDRAGQLADEAKDRAAQFADAAKDKADRFARKADANKDNPVVVGNVVGLVAVGALVGFGAYRKYSAGELTWGVAGAWAAGLGALAVGDAYFSHLLFQNKYPTK